MRTFIVFSIVDYFVKTLVDHRAEHVKALFGPRLCMLVNEQIDPEERHLKQSEMGAGA